MSSGTVSSRGKASYTARTYLTLLALAVAIPLILLLGALLFHSALLERAQFERRVLQALDDLVYDLDRDLDRHLTILRTLATSQTLRDEDWPAFYEEAKAGLQGRAYLVLTDSDGNQIANTYVPYGEQPARTNRPETLQRMSQTKAPVVSSLFTSRVVKQPVFNVSIPILRDGQLRFVMSLGLLPDHLAALLSDQKLGSEWVTMIWDADGVILARSRNHARYIGTVLPAMLRGQGQRAIVRTNNLEGVDVLHATARSQISDWGVGVNVPYSLMSEQWQSAMLVWGVATVSAIALAFGLGLAFAHLISQPLSIASEAAVSLAHGEAVTTAGSRLKEADIFLDTLNSAQRKLADRTAELRRAEEQFRTVVDGAPSAMILTDQEGRIALVNEQAENLFGYRRAELVGQKIEMLVPERLRDKHPADRANYVAHPIMRLMGASRDVFARRKDGAEVPVEIGLSPIVTAAGNMVLSAIADITARKKAEESQQLVIRELHHRTQNLLTVVQTVANRSMDEAKTFADAKLVMNGRLKALSHAYAMLADASWEGAPLQKIIERQIRGMSSRIKLSGCDLIVVPTAAQQFAMIIHELTTNALKYGSLSTPQGSVSIEGNIDRNATNGTLSFIWREIGGPTVSPPTRRGFGSVILLDSAKYFAEDVSIEYSPTGLVYGLKLRLRDIEANRGADAFRAT